MAIRRLAGNVAFAAGIALPILVVAGFALVGPWETAQRAEDRFAPSFRLNIDVQKYGPLGYGTNLTVEEAEAQTPYPLPVPPTNATTGKQTGVWVGGGGDEPGESVPPSVGFVWETDLRFVIHPTDPTDLSEGEAINGWLEKSVTQAEEGWVITAVRGHTAIGKEAQGENLASLTWMENGLVLSFRSPQHSLSQLQELAERVAYQ
ncbi:MAG: hypothetical protein ACRDGU_07245 [Actinomycetota bacterium]